MRSTKKLALSAILTALGTVILSLGGFFGVLDLSAAALASLLVAFAYIELGSPYTWLIWICTTVLSAIILPASLMWGEYLVAFGIYPILKGGIEGLRRPLWIPLKLVFACASLSLVVFIGYLIGVPFLESGLWWLRALTCALALVTFVIYDLCITSCVRYYTVKLRPRFKNLLR